ncbi:hypothetical protein [Candidatus Binatus sp.]|uniref:hypothetical protein n=1 Tax=Candidatus Binatus sp. TaxID=2811406 RepID=UPI002F938DCB
MGAVAVKAEVRLKGAAPAASYALVPGVIVDPVRGRAYLMNPRHGIDAIEISSGKKIWSTAAASKPLAVFNDQIVAQMEGGAPRSMAIALLDVNSPAKPILTAQVPLPTGVTALIDEAIGLRFSATARVTQDGILVTWQSNRQTVSGIARPGPPEVSRNSGAALIDPQTGAVRTLAEIPHDESGTVAKTIQRLAAAGVERPWRVGDFILAVAVRKDRTIIRRWDAANGKPIAEIELEPGFGLGVNSADGRQIAANKPDGADAHGVRRYDWEIYSLKAGTRAASVMIPTSAAPFFTWHTLLVYVSQPLGYRTNGGWVQAPLAIRAVEIKTGAEVWKRPLRDTRYRGPFVPAHPPQAPTRIP